VQGSRARGNFVVAMSPHPDLEHILRDVAAARAVAADVLTDGHAVDDVVQETLLAASQRRDVASGDGTLRAWMRATARNLALAAARRDRRREHREEAAARIERVPSAAEVLERLALQRRVAAAVEALPSPDREIVALRYWDDAPPREIARRLGLSPNAVSTRLTRARAQLALALGADDPRESSRWALVVAAWRPRVAIPVHVTWIPLATVAMKPIVLAALVLAAALLVHSALRPARQQFPDGGAALTAASPAELIEPARANDEPSSDRAPTANGRVAVEVEREGRAALSVPSVPQPTTGRLEVRVTEATNGAAVAGAGLEVWAWSSPRIWLDMQRTTTNSAGLAVFEGVHPGKCTVYIHRLTLENTFDAETLDLSAGETRAVQFAVVPGVTFCGVVRDCAGRAVPGAEVWLGDGSGPPTDGDVVTTTDAQGRYELRHVATIQGVAARAAGLAPSRPIVPLVVNASPDDSERERYTIDLVLPALGGLLEGEVLDTVGAPVPGALVVIGDALGGRAELIDGKRVYPPPRLVLRTDEAGRFATDLMGAGTLAVRARGADTAIAEAQVEVPVDGRFEFRHVPRGTYQVRMKCAGHGLKEHSESLILDETAPHSDLGLLQLAPE